MGSAMTTSTPINQVDDLIKQVADEAGLEVSEQLAAVPTGKNLRFILTKYCDWQFVHVLRHL